MSMAMCNSCGKRALCRRTREEAKDAQGREQCEYMCDDCWYKTDDAPDSGVSEKDYHPGDDIPFW